MTIEVHRRPGRPAPARLHGGLGRGMAWTVGYAVVWLGLASWRPTTTWHLAPVLVAAALPWFVVTDLASVRRKALAVVLAAVAGGSAAALITTVLSALGLVQGPSLRHSDGAVAEALLLSGATALVAAVVGLVLAARRGGADATTS